MGSNISDLMKRFLELTVTDENARNIIEKYEEQDRIDEGLQTVLEELLDELREYYCENDSKLYEFDDVSEEIVVALNDLVKRGLIVYDAFRVVRENPIDQSYHLLEKSFDNCILRRNIENENDLIEMNPEQMRTFIKAFRALVYDCVSKNLGESSIEKSINMNTRIQQILVDLVTRKINNSFLELKLNYIILKMK